MEDENPIKKTVVIYVGRFQPMHKGHAGTYQHLVKKFGKDNVFVGTSDKVERPKSPFNFKEKVKIMTTMFGIPKSKIHKVKNPYKPTEILKKFDEETTAFVTVVGEKDKNRLGSGKGRYFQPYKGEPSVGYRDGGYVYAAPQSGGGISGTETRNGLSVGSDEQKKNFFKKRAYGKFNATIFKMITDKLDEGIEISKEMIEDWLINESSNISTGQVDDGPNFFFPNYDVFSKINVKRATRIGYEVVNMIANKELEDIYDHPIYPNGPVKAVTPFPAGVLGTTTATNQVDIYSSDAYSKWFKHVTRKAAMVGYELVKSLASKEDLKQDKEQSVEDAKGDKVSQKEYEASLNEVIKLPVKVGDTILTGRFKNKKTVVKTIGKDEHGMPTINGRKVVNFRLVKEGFIAELGGTAVKCEKCNHSWDIESEDTEKYLCHSCGWDSQKQEYDFDAFDSWKEKMGLNEDSPESAHPQGSKKIYNRTTVMDMLDVISHKEFGPDYYKLSDSQKKKVVKIAKKHKLVTESKGKLRPADLLRRKAAMAGKRAQIARRRARTMKRRKPLSKLKKIAYKKAYLQVYDEFRNDLFPGIAKKDLSIQQAKIVHKNVLRKKKRVLKRARFRFLPALRDKEAQKFGKKDEMMIGYAGPEDMKRFAKRNKEYRKDSDSSQEYQYQPIKEVNEFFYMDFKKYVYKNRKQINQKIKGLSDKEKKKFLELLWKKQIGKGFGKDADGSELHQMLKKDKVVKEGLKELGITDFKSLFRKMPSDLQKRVYNLKNFGQRLDKHPEGNVLKHTIKVVNRSIKDDDIDIAIAAMFHDIGKDETAGIHPKKGHITHFGHEKVSASLVKKYRKFIESVGGNTANVFYIVKNHMKYKQLSVMTPKKVNKVKSFRAFDKLGKFSKHDRGGLDEQSCDAPLKGESEQDFRRRCFGYNPLTPPAAGLQRLGAGKENDLKESIEMIRLKKILKEVLLKEGGAYGHMSHPFDSDINLTFGQLKDIVNRALEGTLEFTREKTDGQALAISWRDGRLVAARNKGHLKNKGENALDIKGVSDKFQGRGGLSDAYNYAMKDLSNAIKSLNDKQRDKIFKQGACFMNLEVIYPTSVNVIPYGQALLVFHGTMEYNDEGVAIGENGEAARILAGMIKQVNKDVQDNYTIQGPPVVKLPKSQDLSKKRSKYSSQITKLQKEFGLKDTDGVANYHQSWWEQWVDKNSPSSLDNKTKMGLVKRWAFMDKKFRLDNKNISDSKTLEWAKKTDKDNHKKISKDNLMKFEKIFLGLGAEVLEFTSSALTVNPDKAVRDIKKRIDKTIKDVQKSGDPKKIEKLKLELGRLNSIGGSKKIVPNEGIVFLYKGNTFKLTGTFASVNQILGIFF
jgi:Zn finger protein HypA/HybF involved in hydrogenase expression